jgi:hypothetical protein
MLHPAFFVMPLFDDSRRKKRPDPTEVGWRVIGYSTYNGYTLVSWRVKSLPPARPPNPNAIFSRHDIESDMNNGETLYRGIPPNHEVIASSWWRIAFYDEKLKLEAVPRNGMDNPSVWNRPAWKAGAYGLSSATARALRNPLNYITFEP